MREFNREEPISFDIKEFENEKNFQEYIENKKYILEKRKDDLCYFSRKDYDTKGLRMNLFISKDEVIKQIAYIDSIYYPSSKNLYISIFNVDPNYRNKGYGTQIYNIFEDKVLSEFDIKIITGKLGYWIEEKKRENFFKSLGFKLLSSSDDGRIDEIEKNF
ncbi:GNAT family N-acetyltransferase [Lactococcus formosensis subsp. formosensis]|uniref:GNAT family N-acetyltransferase n=1 Tax=Lactococcus formosensis TaxID=1281486 RepID=UPI00385347D3